MNGTAGMGRPEWDGRNGRGRGPRRDPAKKIRRKQTKKKKRRNTDRKTENKIKRNKIIIKKKTKENCGFNCPERPGLSQMV